MDRLKLCAPLATLTVTQKFGDDRVCIDSASRRIPMSRINGTCAEGYESFNGVAGLTGHNGIDFLAAWAEPVYAATTSIVTEVVQELERGLGIGVVTRERWYFAESKENTAGEYYAKTRYWQLESVAVAKSGRVHAGQVIGYADNTGISTGSHLHFELKPVLKCIRIRYRNAFQENGYRGAIDPVPYLSS